MRAAVAEPACRSRIFPGIFAGKRVQSLPCQQRCQEVPAPARFHPAPFLEEARTVRQSFVILSLLLACAPLLPAVDTQAACTAGNCQNGRGVLTGQNGLVYTGVFKKGLPWGEGRLSLPGGTVYVGHFVHGVYHGKGTLTRSDGSVYRGTFDRGRHCK